MPYLEKQPKLSITAKAILKTVRSKTKKTLMVVGMASSMLATSANVNALGLGVLDIQSNLDQPLNGVITISVAPGDDLSSLEAVVASREEFESLGVDYPEYLKNIVLEVERSGAGGVLRVSSQDVVIKEPFIHFLVKVTWSGGSFIREYTALIDPPVYAAETPKSVAQPRAVGTDQTYTPRPAPQQQQAETPAQEAAPVVQQPQAPAQRSVEQAVTSQPSAPSSDSSEDAQYGPVAAGESLSLIAQELQRQVPDLSIYAIMQVLFEENRDAFIQGNINGLIKGSVLKIGSLDRIRNADLVEARQFFQQQVEAWDPSYLIAASDRDSGIGVGQDTYSGDSEDIFGDTTSSESLATTDSFQVGASSDLDSFVSTAEGGNNEGEVLALRQELAQLQGSLASSELENQELRERVSILEGQLADVNRLIDISVEDAELASLESNLAAQNNNEQDALDSFESGGSSLLDEGDSIDTQDADATASVDDVLSEFLDDPLESGDDIAQNLDIQDPLASVDDLSDEDADTSGDALTLDDTQSVIEELDEESAISTLPLDSSSDSIEQDSFLDKIGGLVPVLGGLGAILLGGLGLFFLRRRKADEEFEISMLSIESNSQSIDIDTETGMSASMSTTASTSVLSDDTSTQEGGDKETSFLTVYSDSDAVVQADEVDPIAEADVYIAYGRDEQAEEVLLDGIASNPDRADVKQKLIGLYYKNKNVEGFERIAEELYGQADQIGAEGWQEISDMGKELSPENPLFDLPPAEVATGSDDAQAAEVEDDIEAVTEPVEQGDEDDEELLVFDTVDESDEEVLAAQAPEIAGQDSTSSDHSEMVVDSLNEDASIQLINFDDGRSEISELDEVEIDALALEDDDEDVLSFDTSDDQEPNVGDELDLSEQIEDIEASDLVLDFDDQDSETDESSEAEFGEERRVSEVPEVSDLVIDPEYDESQTQYELAKVFVDLGDEDGARKILEELVSNPDNSAELKEKSQELLDSMS